MDLLEKYSILAGLFDYPDPQTEKCLASTLNLLSGSYPEGLEAFAIFRQEFIAMDQHQREEYFINTFDVEAVTSMDLGFILFGEDYKRGNFLAMMQQEQVQAGNHLGSELADHLPNVLRLMPLMTDKEVAAELAFSIIIPAVREILKKFGAGGNIFQKAFQTLLAILQSDFGNLSYEQYQVQPCSTEFAGAEYACGGDFLNEIGKQKF